LWQAIKLDGEMLPSPIGWRMCTCLAPVLARQAAEVLKEESTDNTIKELQKLGKCS
jgi:hypothetical protein